MTTRLLLEIVGENRHDFEMKLEAAFAKLGYEKPSEHIDFLVALEQAICAMGYDPKVIVNDHRIRIMKQINEAIKGEKVK